MNGFHGRIVGIVYAKDNFVFRVILDAVAAETLIHLRVNPAQRLQDGNRRREVRVGLAAIAQKSPDAPQAEHIKPHATQGQGSRNETAEVTHHEIREAKLLLYATSIVCYVLPRLYLSTINAL